MAEGPSRISSYGEFWKFYVGEHSLLVTRRLHFLGTSLVLLMLILGLALSPRFLILMPVCGYLFAWIGHFGFEKNRPATFKYPLWSLLADFQMFLYILSGRMEAEVEKHARPLVSRRG